MFDISLLAGRQSISTKPKKVQYQKCIAVLLNFWSYKLEGHGSIHFQVKVTLGKPGHEPLLLL